MKRETGSEPVSPKGKKSILCPSCRRLVSRDELFCPYCGAARPGRWHGMKHYVFQMANGNIWVRNVIWLNIILYGISLMLNRKALGLSMNPLTALSPDSTSLLLMGATGTIPIDRYHHWWSLITANFLHANLVHIFFNMVVLNQLAPLVFRAYGAYRVTLIYILGGVAGYYVSYLAGVPLTIGASAAVCSLVGSLLYYGKSRGGFHGRALFKQLGMWVVMLIAIGILFPIINNWGHGGGIAAGIGLGYLLGYTERRPEGRLHRALGMTCGILTLLVIVVTVGVGVIQRMGMVGV